MRKVLIAELEFLPCTDSSELQLLQFTDVEVFTTQQGDLVVSGSLKSDVFLTPPIKVSVSLQRRIMGLWIHVPCIKNFGSCDYQDICDYAFPIEKECIPVLDENDVPCHCPIEESWLWGASVRLSNNLDKMKLTQVAQIFLIHTQFSKPLKGWFSSVLKWYTPTSSQGRKEAEILRSPATKSPAVSGALPFSNFKTKP